MVKTPANDNTMADNLAAEQPEVEAMSPIHEEEIEEAMKDEIFELGANIYSALLIVPFTAPVMGPWKHRIFIAEYYSLLIANALVQGVITIYIRVIYNEASEENGRCGAKSNSKPLRWVCILCYIGYVIGDLNETWNMALWLYNVSRGGPIQMCCSSGSSDDGLKTQSTLTGEVAFTIVDGDGNEGNKITEALAENVANMNCCERLFMYFCVLGYKFGIAAALIGYGSGYIIASESEGDILLNALALCFVLEIDEMIYGFFCGADVQTLIESDAPRVSKKVVNPKNKECWRVTVIPFKVVLLTVITYVENQFYCPGD